MRRLLGVIAIALALPSTAGASVVFLIDGRGWGHGVGLAQWGAEGFARHGWTHERILAHYYPGTRLTAVAPREVRVQIAEGRARVRVGSSMPFLVRDARGRERHAKRAVVLTIASKLPVTFTPGAAPLTLDGAGYRGELTVTRAANALRVVNRLPLERYLRGVVPWEMPEHWHAAAYEAQAVAARSYALSRLDPSRPYDLVPDASDQVYGGIRAERPETNLAVGATAGRVLTYDGRVITAYYHSSSGGRTAAVEDVWSDRSPVPYLVSVPDPFDGISPNHRWGPVAQTSAELGERLGVPALVDALVDRTKSGFVQRVRVVTGTGARIITAREFADAVGLRSTAFAVRALGLEAPARRQVLDNRPIALTGFVRGLGGVELQERTSTGAWRTVSRIHPAPSGRFKATIRPRRTTSYRLTAQGATGPQVEVRVAGG
jgi:SpoIID/LytB domain protein